MSVASVIACVMLGIVGFIVIAGILAHFSTRKPGIVTGVVILGLPFLCVAAGIVVGQRLS